MVYVYVIRSQTRNYNYVGISSELEVRVERHNKGQNKTTKSYTPFDLIYTKAFPNHADARVHEKFLKSGKGRAFIKTL
ncbi:putative endonuclease [Roseivirga pacifica]|uniref:Putative endonuclease n=1 Tax=Roseivirga pacifica TaxID=1267423 RepID=A0A1I0NPG7_9BACT|nr:GIY-YIG nuclease family protein [Roseivirga pacifica]RKQ51356.1 putative endonuclease [Roseivirga pacifica]SEW03287.1 putative endonuclease [Roseivirga pacifica]